MRLVLFIVCFTLGVTLMVMSGYLPRRAAAGSDGQRRLPTPGDTVLRDALLGQTVTRTVPTTPRGPTEEPLVGNQPADWTSPLEQSRAGREPDPSASEGQNEAISTGPQAGTPEPDAPPDQPPDAGLTPARSTGPTVSADPERPAEAHPGSAPPTGSASAAGEAAQSTAEEEDWPFADAGPDRVIWMGWNELTLDGRASTGQQLAFHWEQVSGPVPLKIRNERRPLTVASGLVEAGRPQWQDAVYEFELTVTDAGGRQDTDRVAYIVKAAPSLKIRPNMERRFEVRDGYELGHFIAWVTNLDSYETVFELSCESELTFTRVRGGPYSLTGGKSDDQYVYQIVLYGQPGQPTSWVEFLVDTEDKVPGIVQLGVNWEGR